ncbi:hypothetical protein M422DRAFT_254252 [Sphaerobolus stellatus SS14]|uniref:Unplaced genomic scaffold SPHSTscaffold_54, whole genome shotgun sequence n=1 Tax=Sphaerobolus stellatus (strain SS14) TaxID=990650 RepID=A0A0C9UHF8_SPHS4|nr:hypothetical protein M422DRAFT_254252 [Sphaerobolus stellatus SS14]
MAEFSTLLHLTLVRLAVVFPVYESLVGLSEREINLFIASNGVANIPNSPGPLAKGQDGLKLVNDTAHPFIPAGPNDIRGPCPSVLNHISEEAIFDPSMLSDLKAGAILACRPSSGKPITSTSDFNMRSFGLIEKKLLIVSEPEYKVGEVSPGRPFEEFGKQ